MKKDAVRQKLNERYLEIQDRLKRVARDGRHSGGLAADFAEQAVERENDEVLASLEKAMRAEMTQIEHTLARVDSGEYGFCDVCRKAITPQRLEALPYATRCVDCETGPADQASKARRPAPQST